MATNKDWKGWRKQTLAVRGGQRRTPFQETSEALFMTAGYAYEVRYLKQPPLPGR